MTEVCETDLRQEGLGVNVMELTSRSRALVSEAACALLQHSLHESALPDPCKSEKLARCCYTLMTIVLLNASVFTQTGILGSGSFGIVIRAVDETAIPKHEVHFQLSSVCYFANNAE